MTGPSSPALIAIWRAGQLSALRTISTPVFWSFVLHAQLLQDLGAAQHRSNSQNHDRV